MSPTIKQLDPVRLTKDIPAEGLAAGAPGTVLEVFGKGEAYLVEFCNGNGETLAMPTLQAGDIAPLKRSTAPA